MQLWLAPRYAVSDTDRPGYCEQLRMYPIVAAPLRGFRSGRETLRPVPARQDFDSQHQVHEGFAELSGLRRLPLLQSVVLPWTLRSLLSGAPVPQGHDRDACRTSPEEPERCPAV